MVVFLRVSIDPYAWTDCLPKSGTVQFAWSGYAVKGLLHRHIARRGNLPCESSDSASVAVHSATCLTKDRDGAYPATATTWMIACY
jgi:hypothetical protein